MKVDSIKYRLLLITFVCVFGMLLLIINQIYYTDRLIELNQQNKVLLRMGNELLQLRRHEKDFLMRKDGVYVERFLTRVENFAGEIDTLADIFSQHNVATELVKNIEASFADYQNKFNWLVELQVEIGLDETKGQQARLQMSVDALHQALADVSSADTTSVDLTSVDLTSVDLSSPALLAKFLAIREFEKDFLLYQKTQYLDKQLLAFDAFIQLLQQAPDRTALLALANRYQQHFIDLTGLLKTMGLTHNQGLRGDFRGQAHIVEEHLGIIDRTLLPLILEEERRVKLNGLLIMALTIAALVILIVRSFVTFQRAFSNFVMFFYRCKREYQRMDERKLGFAEFKSLAAVANEMVEARRETEAELKEVKQELAVLKKTIEEQ